MVSLAKVIKSFGSNPGYTAMRGLARFESVRRSVTYFHNIFYSRALKQYLDECEENMKNSLFSGVNKDDFFSDLQQNGLAFGLTLPDEVLDGIIRFAEENEVYADRRPDRGFQYTDRPVAEAKLGKPVLVAQYFNTTESCQQIDQLRKDPLLNWIAGKYLGSPPTFVGANLWWTFPVVASDEDRSLHAHFFHRDADDFRFFKYFFYLTDVKENEGAHVCVPGSVHNPPILKRTDKWQFRRYTDDEIETYYGSDKVLEVTGKAGEGFAEDTLCIHKGSTPLTEPRLLLQLQFALFDYGAMSDDIESGKLHKIV